MEQAIAAISTISAGSPREPPEVRQAPVAPEPSSRCWAHRPPPRGGPGADFDVHVPEPGGRQVYAIALTRR